MSRAVSEARWLLAPTTGGGWSLETDDPATTLRVLRERDSWSVDGSGDDLPARIVATPPAGFEAQRADGEALARSSAPLGIERDTRLRHLLLADGRVFRVVRCAGAGAGFDLLGWETPGSYLEARRVDHGWSVIRTPAGRAVAGLTMAALLFCMEIVDAESVATTDGT